MTPERANRITHLPLSSPRSDWLTKPGLSVLQKHGRWRIAGRADRRRRPPFEIGVREPGYAHRPHLRLLVDECPKAYFWQVQGQMLATGRAWCDFVSVSPEFPGELQIVIRRARDQQARWRNWSWTSASS